MSTSIEYASFLIRVWREATPPHAPSPPEPALSPVEGLGGTEGGRGGAPDWQGEVEHIQTGERWTFGTLDELLGFLRRQVKDSEVLERSEAEK